ncbi:3'(2'),5'-bisphosphate nucleotidase 1-like [Montipora capricornis]|uniref:3'(2'),5'-bisphosphate nucleotidase 1-like n=1 Tax=Montipora capricornis TaxID=246305 RepID=UPI0035F1D3CC
MASSSFLMRLVSSSVAVANKAGGIIRSILKTRSLAVVDKGNDGQFDPQTEADRASQKCIIGSLLKMYPTLQIIGEEEGIQLSEEYIIEVSQDVDVLRKSCPKALASVKPEEVTVWVDPLDGTREFTEGLYDHVTVLIGISMNGKPIAGIIHQPFYGYEKNPQGTELGRTMWGVRGLGTFGFNHNPPPKGRCVVTTTRTHLHKTAMEAIEAMKPDQILKVGGAGYKVLLLLEGTADVYVFASRGCQRWDTCAGEALLEAVGGTLTDICGEHIKYDGHASSYANNTGVLASLKDHKLYVDMIPESVKGHLLRKL